MKVLAGLCYLVAAYFARKHDIFKMENEGINEDHQKFTSEQDDMNKETSF